MSPVQHAVISSGLSLILGTVFRSWEAAAACFISGVFIDVDHIWDYFVATKKISLRYKDLDDFCSYHKESKLYLWFHSYESLVVLWSIIFFLNLDVIWVGAALGLTVHLVCDQFANPLNPLAYFLTFRVIHSFERKKIFNKAYASKYFSIILIAVLLQFFAINDSCAAETMTYVIKKAGIRVGEASLEFGKTGKRNGKEFPLIIFTAEAFKFYDKEMIYLDPQTLYPIYVDRDLNIFGKKEKISEEYLQDRGLIKIVKTAGKKTEEMQIEKTGPVDNIYCFIYRLRQSGDFKVGNELKFNLPTKDVIINMKEQVELKSLGKKVNTMYMESDPSDYRLWFDLTANHVPLRIDGAMGMAKTSLILSGYQKSSSPKQVLPLK